MFVLPTALRGVSVLFAVVLVVSAAQAADDASDQTPPSNVRGETYNGGPKNVFDKGEKSGDKKSEVKKDDKKHDDKEHKDHKDHKHGDKDHKHEKKDDKKASVDPKAAPGEAGKPASPASPWGDSALSLLNFPEEKSAAAAAPKSAYEIDQKYRGAVARLCTSGWREAQDELVRGGRTSVPYLIEAMGKNENAYHNGGHTKADASRALRQRPLNEVCCEILRTIVTTRSNYKGDLPGSDAQAWQTWFSTQGSNVTFAN